jgi:ubiquinol-cytochrome c reductase cytochrome b subunit
LPRLGLACLLWCLVSGIILTFFYRPFGNVFQNVEEITTLVPYGHFFRQLHYSAGQMFVILMLIHTMDHFIKKQYRTYPLLEWNRLVLSLCLCFLTLFTGFILKGDKEAIFAGRIFMNILRAVPVAGRHLATIFIVPGEDFFFLPYLYHCFFLPLLIIYLLRAHIREWLPDLKFLYLTAIGLFLYAMLVAHHMDIPPEAHVDIVKGPWFFLGIQSLLKIIPPLLAGLIIPAAFLGGLLILPVTGRSLGNALHYLIMVLSCLYGILVLRAMLWSP